MHDIAKDTIVEKVSKATEKNLVHNNHKIRINPSPKIPTLIPHKQTLSLFPVWFSTYRHKNRVSYGVVNGQTGKMFMDVPVSKTSFFLFVTFLSIILSGLSYYLFSTTLPTLTPSVVSLFTVVIMTISSFVLYKELKQIQKRESLFSLFPTSPKNHLKYILFFILGLFFIFFAYMTIILSFIFKIALPIFSVFCHIILLFCCKKISPAKILLILPSFFVSIISFLIILFNPVSDLYFYIASALNVFAIIINGLICIKKFNELTSSPVPNFFERSGATYVK